MCIESLLYKEVEYVLVNIMLLRNYFPNMYIESLYFS